MADYSSYESDDNDDGDDGGDDDDEEQGLIDDHDNDPDYFAQKQQINKVLRQRSRSAHQIFEDDNYDYHKESECDDDDDEELEFYTYDTAPRENRIQIFWNIYQQWSRCLPTGGVERMLCIMMATFLVLMIFSIQLCLRIDGYLDWIWSSNSLHFPWKYFWWWNSNHRKNHRICEPPNYDEKISFDCYVLLLIIGWLSSMFLAIFTMAIHFVYWWWRWYYFRRRQ
uniref:Uncharacterized protein LOC113798644 n=1 Tax=Dermatophagoides pteronyssinus TaxID=6956 RepID=A0A6P6YIA5_DERPT|nr:uncharacterized protein LOC113798644 [Dermatophagoides pteronyssinus]